MKHYLEYPVKKPAARRRNKSLVSFFNYGTLSRYTFELWLPFLQMIKFINFLFINRIEFIRLLEFCFRS